MPGLRICGIVPIYCHPEWRGGGLSRTATDLLMVQAKRGNRVRVISPLFDGDRDFPLPETRTYFDGCLELIYNRHAKRSRFGIGTSSHGLAEQMWEILPQCDVVHIHSFLSPWTDRAAREALRAGVPYAIQDHGKLTPSVMRNRGKAKQLYLRLGGRKILRRAACVLPSAEVVAEQIREWDGKITCASCTNGLDPAEFDGPLGARPIGEPYVLFLGWLDPRKNPDLLVRAFASIASECAPWKLALVGPDSYGMQERLTRLIVELGMQDRVLMPGMARGAAKLAWLRHAGIFVLPSEGEGLSLSMLEAAACGLPMLLTEGCNYPEATAHGAGRVLELTPKAWAGAMLELIRDQPTRELMGAQARGLFLKLHTLDAVGEHLEGILKRAAQRSQSGK